MCEDELGHRSSSEHSDAGAWQFQGYDEKSVCRSQNGRLTGVHKVLSKPGGIACNGRQDFYLGSDGGFKIPVNSKIGQEMRIDSGRLVSWYGRKQLIPVYIEDNMFNFYFSKEMQSTETNIVNNHQQSGNEYGRAMRLQVQRKF